MWKVSWSKQFCVVCPALPTIHYLAWHVNVFSQCVMIIEYHLASKYDVRFTETGFIGCVLHFTVIKYKYSLCISLTIHSYVTKAIHCRRKKIKHLPIPQWTPVYPATQLHVYPLTSSAHTPPFSHGVLVHSFISRIKYMPINHVTMLQCNVGLISLVVKRKVMHYSSVMITLSDFRQVTNRW